MSLPISILQILSCLLLITALPMILYVPSPSPMHCFMENLSRIVCSIGVGDTLRLWDLMEGVLVSGYVVKIHNHTTVLAMVLLCVSLLVVG